MAQGGEWARDRVPLGRDMPAQGVVKKVPVDAGRNKIGTQGPWVLRPEGSVLKCPDALNGSASWLPSDQQPFPGGRLQV